jgi:peptidase E
MNLALTSDFPSTHNTAVIKLLQSRAGRIAWIPPLTAAGRKRFPIARHAFAEFGLELEYCDIDESPAPQQLQRLHEFAAVCLTGGDPLAFHRNARHIGLAERLQEYLDADGLIVAASGGAMLLTQNVSMFRLVDTPLDKVVAEHSVYQGMALVDYELLPHLDRLSADLIAVVDRYSTMIPHRILALSDGAAVLYTGTSRRCMGTAVWLHDGARAPAGVAAGR